MVAPSLVEGGLPEVEKARIAAAGGLVALDDVRDQRVLESALEMGLGLD